MAGGFVPAQGPYGRALWAPGGRLPTGPPTALGIIAPPPLAPQAARQDARRMIGQLGGSSGAA